MAYLFRSEFTDNVTAVLPLPGVCNDCGLLKSKHNGSTECVYVQADNSVSMEGAVVPAMDTFGKFVKAIGQGELGIAFQSMTDKYGTPGPVTGWVRIGPNEARVRDMLDVGHAVYGKITFVSDCFDYAGGTKNRAFTVEWKVRGLYDNHDGRLGTNIAAPIIGLPCGQEIIYFQGPEREVKKTADIASQTVISMTNPDPNSIVEHGRPSLEAAAAKPEAPAQMEVAERKGGHDNISSDAISNPYVPYVCSSPPRLAREKRARQEQLAGAAEQEAPKPKKRRVFSDRIDIVDEEELNQSGGVEDNHRDSSKIPPSSPPPRPAPSSIIAAAITARAAARSDQAASTTTDRAQVVHDSALATGDGVSTTISGVSSFIHPRTLLANRGSQAISPSESFRNDADRGEVVETLFARARASVGMEALEVLRALDRIGRIEGQNNF
ncbi:hypothetical protein BJ508DRAFT_305796 [Ascobolus immersus RN42]|uniref:Uncharacterized protein n=1 Tax=Ascobolus immersus RN42 TaxID=1160509 RepID=A0A3N4ILB4_ASCIM|nr:hypothetical protein BJ508DRAFT_305796 [Ascobolus immersus RN42]